MKLKMLVQFQNKERRIWLKNMGDYYNANFILLAEVPGNKVFYASTIRSDLLEEHQKNQVEKVEGITLVKHKHDDGKFLQILFRDGEMLDLKQENYCLLFYFPNSEHDSEDYMLVFNFPSMLGKGARYQVFLSDQENQNAMAIFWMLKEFIMEEGDEGKNGNV